MTRKYIDIYLKRNALLSFFCAIIAFIPLFVVSLIYDVVSYDLAVAFAPFALAFGCFLISIFPILRFKKMISEQEKIYNVTFSDVGATNLETVLYLGDDWLIYAGSCALYKKHIRGVKHKTEHGRAGSSNRVTITTVDGKRYAIWCLSTSNVNKIKSWVKGKN